MNLNQVFALRALGIHDDQITAMAGQPWPAGIPRKPSEWDDRDERCLRQYAANCLHSENVQDVAELDAMDAAACDGERMAGSEERRMYNKGIA